MKLNEDPFTSHPFTGIVRISVLLGVGTTPLHEQSSEALFIRPTSPIILYYLVDIAPLVGSAKWISSQAKIKLPVKATKDRLCVQMTIFQDRDILDDIVSTLHSFINIYINKCIY